MGTGDHPNALVGVGLAAREGAQARAFYLPLAHVGLGGRIPASVKSALGALLGDRRIQKVGFGLKHMATALRTAGLDVAGLAFDAELASYLVDPGRREHVLGDVVRRLLSATLPTIAALEGTRRKVELAELDPTAVAPLAAASAEAGLSLVGPMTSELEQVGVASLFHDLEMPLLAILAEMEWTGVRVDLEALAALGTEVDGQIASIEQRIYELAGAVFNVASNRQLAEILFEKLKLPVVRRTKTGPSTDQDVLEKLALSHPLPAAVIELRQLSKLKGTYIDALPELVDPRDGRVHTTFNQAIAATGRLSSSDPNLQNIPTRTELGKRIRRRLHRRSRIGAGQRRLQPDRAAHPGARVRGPRPARGLRARPGHPHPDRGGGLRGVPGGRDPADAQRGQGHQFRHRLRAVGLRARAAAGAAEQGGPGDHRPLLRSATRGVRRWLDATIDEARRDGAVSTLFGRRRLLPEIQSKNLMVRQGAERMAVNTPIQGTAADLIKRAMLRVDETLRQSGLKARMTLQVHDELVFEVAERDAEQIGKLAREAMVGAGQLSVPLVVSVGVSSNWAEAH